MKTTIERLRENGINLFVSENVLAELKHFDDIQADRENEFDEIIELDKFYDNHIANADTSTDEFRDNWSYYSDWHKDIYGCRPRR